MWFFAKKDVVGKILNEVWDYLETETNERLERCMGSLPLLNPRFFVTFNPFISAAICFAISFQTMLHTEVGPLSSTERRVHRIAPF